jgi:hypothetical protein
MTKEVELLRLISTRNKTEQSFYNELDKEYRREVVMQKFQEINHYNLLESDLLTKKIKLESGDCANMTHQERILAREFRVDDLHFRSLDEMQEVIGEFQEGGFYDTTSKRVNHLNQEIIERSTLLSVLNNSQGR